MASTEVKLQFLSSLEHFWPESVGYFVQNFFIFWENAQSLQK